MKIRRRFSKGIELTPEDLSSEDLSRQGELAHDSSDDKLKYRNSSATKEVVDTDSAQTLDNKTYTYDNSTSGLTATNVQDAIDEVEGRLDTAETNISNNTTTISSHLIDAVDAHDASAISNVPSGNLAATDVQGALNELQSDIDTRALDADLDAHVNDTTDAHDATAISYNNATSGLTATDTQAAIDEVEGRVDTIESATYVNSFNTRTGDVVPVSGDYSADEIEYDNTTSGLTATDTQAAIDEVEGRVDTVETDLSNHTGASSGVHGVTGDVVGTTDTQVLTNKDIDGGTASNTSRITLPQDTKANLDGLTRKEATIVYANDEDTAYIDNGTNLIPIGSGSGQGGINYLEGDDTNFENTVGGWTGDTNISVARSTADPLRGDASLQITKAAIDASTQTVNSPTFTVDDADLAKKLTISFDYEFEDVDYADGDAQVRVIQDPAGTPVTIRVNGEDIKAGSGTHYAQFQTDATITDYQVVIYWADTGTSEVVAQIDNVRVGPSNLAFGTIVTDWQEFTPTGSWTTNTTYTGFYRRVGDSIEVQTQVLLSGAPDATGLSINLPSGLLIDVDKVTSTNPDRSVLGSMRTTNAGVNVHSGYAMYNTTSSIQVRYHQSSGAGSPTINTINVSNTNPFTYGTGDSLVVEYQVPIQGWSANAQMSEDLGGREIVVRGAGNGGESISANVTDIPFTEVEDTTASWDGSSFTAPETGYYKITGNVLFTGSPVVREFDAYVDGVLTKRISPAQDVSRSVYFNGAIQLNKGQVLSVREALSGGTLQDSSTAHHIHIQKLASPQTILETETVAARYTSDSGQTVTNGSKVVFEDLGFDTHGAYNTSTGDYTIPTSGFYQVNFNNRPNAAVTAFLSIDINGISISKYGSGTSDTSVISGSVIYYFEKGDTVSVKNITGSNITLTGVAIENTFSIARIK